MTNMRNATRRRTMKKTKTYEFATMQEALEHAAATGWVAIRWEGKNRVVRQESADRLQAEGIEFAFITDHKGQIVLVPVN
jgi:hypothetical protein